MDVGFVVLIIVMYHNLGWSDKRAPMPDVPAGTSSRGDKNVGSAAAEKMGR
jgi:hypothetical protein